MEGEQEGGTVPLVAREFLERHRPAQNNLGSVRRDADHETRNDNDREDDNEAGDQLGDDGELEVESPGVDGGHDVAEDAEPGVPAPPIQPKKLVLGSSPEGPGS